MGICKDLKERDDLFCRPKKITNRGLLKRLMERCGDYDARESLQMKGDR